MKVREGGKITIPKEIRDRYGLHKDVEVEIIPEEQGIFIRKRAQDKHPVAQVYGMIKLRGADSVDELIEEMRGR